MYTPSHWTSSLVKFCTCSSSCYSHRVYLLHILLCSISYTRRLFMSACLPVSLRILPSPPSRCELLCCAWQPHLDLLSASQFFIRAAPCAWVFVNVLSHLPRLAHKTPPSSFHCLKYSLPSIAVPDSVCSQFSATFSMRFATKGVNCSKIMSALCSLI